MTRKINTNTRLSIHTCWLGKVWNALNPLTCSMFVFCILGHYKCFSEAPAKVPLWLIDFLTTYRQNSLVFYFSKTVPC